jgi:hypothetical protein
MKTVVVDNKLRVRIPRFKPGQVFAYEISGEVVTLTPLKPAETVPIKGRVSRRGKRLLGITDRPIDMDALKHALAEFP